MHTFRTTLLKILSVISLGFGFTIPGYSQLDDGTYIIYNKYSDFLACSEVSVNTEGSDEEAHFGNWAQWVNASHLEKFTRHSWPVFFNIKKLENGRYLITNENGYFLTFRSRDQDKEGNSLGHGYGALWAKPEFLDKFDEDDSQLIIETIEGHYTIKNAKGDFLARAQRTASDLGNRAQWVRKKYHDKFTEKFLGAQKLTLCKLPLQDYERIIRAKECQLAETIQNHEVVVAEKNDHINDLMVKSNKRVAALAGGYLVLGGAYLIAHHGNSLYNAAAAVGDYVGTGGHFLISCGSAGYQMCQNALSGIDASTILVCATSVYCMERACRATCYCVDRACNVVEEACGTVEKLGDNIEKSVNRACGTIDFAVEHTSKRLDQAINLAGTCFTETLQLVDKRTREVLELVDTKTGRVLDIVQDDAKQIIKVIDKRSGELISTANLGIRKAANIADRGIDEAGAAASSVTSLMNVAVNAGTLYFLGPIAGPAVVLASKFLFN